jgi:hypothetical protein
MEWHWNQNQFYRAFQEHFCGSRRESLDAPAPVRVTLHCHVSQPSLDICPWQAQEHDRLRRFQRPGGALRDKVEVV